MSLGFDLSVNNYSIDDLLSLLGLGSNPSIPEVNNKLNIFIDMFTGISGENSELVIKFFRDVGKKLNDDFFSATELEANNYFTYTQNFQANNGSTATLPFPMLSSNNNDLPIEELVQCRDVEVEEQIIDSLGEMQISNKETNLIEQYKLIEYSINNLQQVSGTHDRTVFKYGFNHTMNNVTSIYLSSISFPVPYTICEYKNNNKFTIIDNSSNISYDIILYNLYLINNTDLDELKNHLNQNHFNSSASGILSQITVSKISVGSNRYALQFQLSNNPSYTTFSLQFYNQCNCNNCVENYNLNIILGFNLTLYTSDITSRDISGNGIVFKTPRFYMSVDDNQVNFNQSLELIGSSNLTNYVLGTIYLNPIDLVANDHVIINYMNTTDLSQFLRNYYGPVNLNTLTIKFYDVYGVLQQLPEDNFNQENFHFKIKFIHSALDPTILSTETLSNV